MSLAFDTYCLDCRESLGVLSGGYIGFPSLINTTSRNELPSYYPPDSYNEDVHNFGYIYNGLKAINLLPREVEAYKAFLESHVGHRVLCMSDHDETVPDELADMDEWNEFEYEDQNFVEATYQLFCPSCNEIFEIPAGEEVLFRQFDPFTLTNCQIEDLNKYVLSGDMYLNFYCAGVLDPDFLEQLAKFLSNHKNHEIIARLSSN